MTELQKANARMKAIEEFPKTIIESLAKNDQDDKYCFIFLGDRNTGTLVEASSEVKGDFISFMCGLALDPIIRAMIMASLRSLQIHENEKISKIQKQSEIKKLMNELDYQITKYSK